MEFVPHLAKVLWTKAKCFRQSAEQSLRAVINVFGSVSHTHLAEPKLNTWERQFKRGSVKSPPPTVKPERARTASLLAFHRTEVGTFGIAKADHFLQVVTFLQWSKKGGVGTSIVAENNRNMAVERAILQNCLENERTVSDERLDQSRRVQSQSNQLPQKHYLLSRSFR